VVEAKAMSRQAVLELLENALEEKALNDIIAKLEYKPNLSEDDRVRLAEAKGKLEAVRTQRPKISVSKIFDDIGGFDNIKIEAGYKGSPNKTINSYIKNYKDQLKLQEQIQKAKINSEGKSGEEL